MSITFGNIALEDLSDATIEQGLRSNAEIGGYYLQARSYPVWCAVLRCFDAIDPVRMTLRQLFYAMVSRGAIDKTEHAYKSLGDHILKMRRTGTIPYGWIVDNTRFMRKPRSYESVEDFLKRAQEFYRAAVWADLPVRVEVWLEKDALAGVAYDVTSPWDVPLMVTRGFPSETFVYEAAEAINAAKKPTHIYYFGDYDPSGSAISIGLEAKLQRWTEHMIFQRVAVNAEHITALRLPTRPTKNTDSRAKDWAGGSASVELDAIPVDTLRAMMREVIEQHIPAGHLDAIGREEQLGQETLALMSTATDWYRAQVLEASHDEDDDE